MIIVLGTIFLICVLCSVAVLYSDEGFYCKYCGKYESGWKNLWQKRCKSAVGWSLIFCILSFIAFGATWGGSYSNYLKCKSFYDSTVEQYASAVEIYGNKAVIDIEAAAWTDFKYKGYQDNIAKFVADLRNRIIGYNETMVSKMTMNKNPLFSWLVVGPDKDMKLIKMKAALIKVVNK